MLPICNGFDVLGPASLTRPGLGSGLGQGSAWGSARADRARGHYNHEHLYLWG
jgi:hypothetical protein